MNKLQDLVEEYDYIASLPETVPEVDEYLGMVMVAIDNIIDEVCQEIDFNSLIIN